MLNTSKLNVRQFHGDGLNNTAVITKKVELGGTMYKTLIFGKVVEFQRVSSKALRFMYKNDHDRVKGPGGLSLETPSKISATIRASPMKLFTVLVLLKAYKNT